LTGVGARLGTVHFAIRLFLAAELSLAEFR